MNLQRFYDVSQAGDIESFERELRTFAEHQGFPFFPPGWSSKAPKAHRDPRSP